MSIFSPKIDIGTLRIGTIEGASCLNIGNNFPLNFQSQKKQTQGIGSVGGNDNTLDQAKAVIFDTDELQAMNTPDGEIPGWIKEMMLKANQPNE